MENLEKVKEYKSNHHKDKPEAYIYYQLKHRSKGKALLSRAAFNKWYSAQEKNCYYCNTPLIKGGLTLDAQTIDRKDNNNGYLIDNMVLACRRCNIIKGNWLNEIQMLQIAGLYFGGLNRDLFLQESLPELAKEAGYRKTEGKPPVLSGKEIEKLWRPIFVAHGFSGIYEASRAIAQAQLDKVIRFYEKEI